MKRIFEQIRNIEDGSNIPRGVIIRSLVEIIMVLLAYPVVNTFAEAPNASPKEILPVFFTFLIVSIFIVLVKFEKIGKWLSDHDINFSGKITFRRKED